MALLLFISVRQFGYAASATCTAIDTVSAYTDAPSTVTTLDLRYGSVTRNHAVGEGTPRVVNWPALTCTFLLVPLCSDKGLCSIPKGAFDRFTALQILYVAQGRVWERDELGVVCEGSNASKKRDVAAMARW
jgi:hypothetical protein